jgi:hypothetical protein
VGLNSLEGLKGILVPLKIPPIILEPGFLFFIKVINLHY